ncbi:DNA polymerase theta-like [Symsagittifera roscoffensis]|uniref:DNA polymerase theta-like n=1 Tax=Symsagittifera roscoffensis TaxID=84072 RepID=UPI00307B6B51
MTSKTIKSLKLPKAVAEIYESQCGITTVFDWQYECLTTTGVLQGKNLVFSAPTSAGKTLVAELVMIKRILDNNRRCIFILPFVSVVREKVYYMKKLFKRLGIRVEGFMGGEQPNGGLAVCDIAICTIEKANSLVNRLIADNSLASLGMVVVDELHMVGDPNRGYLLELLLTKLIFIMKHMNNKELCHTQILGMSATLPNLDVIASWLDASLYNTDFRPVPLQECLKLDNRILAKGDPQNIRIIPNLNIKQIVDEDNLIGLCYETISDGHSVLIFCPTKVRCEKLTITIGKGFHFILEQPVQTIEESKKEQRERFRAVLTSGREQYEHFTKQLRNCPVGLDKLISDTLYYGVAYHHAGLTFDERDVIEAAFRSGAVRVLIATSTLSSGVNLPARRVIIRTPVFNGSLLDTLCYKQMCGRAGRKGVDNFGESILVCKANEKWKGESLMNSQLKRVESCLNFSSGVTNALKRALLEIIAAGIAKTERDLECYFESTLLHAASAMRESAEVNSQFVLSGFQNIKSQAPNPDGGNVSDGLIHPVSVCVSYLENFEFIRFHASKESEDVGDDENRCNGVSNIEQSRLLYPTQLGVAALSSSFPPHQSLMVFAELQRARRNFCLDDDLHLVYLVTPLYCHEVSANMEWMNFMNLLEALPPSSKRIARLVGIEEGFIAKAVRGNLSMTSGSERTKVDVHKRFYSALVLLDLINEVPLNEVSAKFSVSRGQLQTLQQSAATFSGMVTVFCHRLGWKNLAMLLGSFQSRLNFGVHQELVELVRISVLNAQRARLLFSAGYHTIVHLANAQPDVLEQVLYNRAPFKSKKNGKGHVTETNGDNVSNGAKNEGIWVIGSKNALSEKEAAQIIIAEAKQLVCDDLRMMGIGLLDHERNLRNESSRLDRSASSNNTSRRKSRVSLIEKSLFELDHSTESRKSKTPSKQIKSPISNRTRRRKKTRSKSKSNESPLARSSSLVKNTDSGSQAEPPAKRSSLEAKLSETRSHNESNNKVVPVDVSTAKIALKNSNVSKITDSAEKSAVTIQTDKMLADVSSRKNLISQKRSRSSSIVPALDSSFRKDDIEMSSTPFQSKTKAHPAILNGKLVFNTPQEPKLQSSIGELKPPEKAKIDSQKVIAENLENLAPQKAEYLSAASFEVSFDHSEKSRQILTDSLIQQLTENDLYVVAAKTKTSDMTVASPENNVKQFQSIGIESVSSNLVKVTAETQILEKVTDKRFSGELFSNQETVENNIEESYVEFSNKTYESSFQDEDDEILGKVAEVKQKLLLGNDLEPTSSQSSSSNTDDEDLKFLRFDQIKSSQDVLFEDFDELPPNQLNSTLDEDVNLHLTRSAVSNNRTPRVFEPSESSMLLDSDMLTQALFETIDAKHSFCEEPIEDPVTPQKVAIDLARITATNQYSEQCINEPMGKYKTKLIWEGDPDFEKSLKNLEQSCGLSMSVYVSLSNDESKECNDLVTGSGYETKKGSLDLCNRPARAEVVICMCAPDDPLTAYYLRINQFDKQIVKESNILNKLSSLIRSNTVVCFDGKRVLSSISSMFDVMPERPLFDLGLAWWVLNSCEKDMGTSGLSVAEICSAVDPGFDWEELCGVKIWKTLTTKIQGFYSNQNETINRNICAVLSVLAARLYRLVNKKLQSLSLESYFNRVESKIQLMNYQLEHTGFLVSSNKFRNMKEFCIARIQKLKHFARSFTVKEFDLGSPEDVGFALYFDLKLPPNGDLENMKPGSNFQQVLGLKRSDLKSKRINGKLKLPPEFNTRNETLMKLKEFHILPSVIIEFRKIKILLAKLSSFSRLISQDGRLKCTCDSLSETGRMRFKEPNIQNVPKSFSLLDLSPRKLRRRSTRNRSLSNDKEFTELNCRDLFIPCSEDFTLVAADYSQLELRILAHFSGDETLLEFLNGGGDVFKSIASVWKDVKLDKVSELERNNAKQMCYGIVYGMGAKALSEQLGTSVSDAEKFIRSFRMAFPALFDFVDATIEFCQKHEYVQTICGRKRNLPEVNSQKAQKRSHAERQAVNSRIQGSASEILKLAIVNINRQLVCNGFRTCFNAESRAKESDRFCVLVLHLHDEVIYEVEKRFLPEVVALIRHEMQLVLSKKLKVKLPVKVKSGPSWGQLIEIVELE